MTEILQPTLMNKFRFRIDAGNRFSLVTMQTTKLDINMVKREITVWVEQPVHGCQDLLDCIEDIGTHARPAFIEMLDGNETVTGTIKCVAELIDHSLKLDYSVCETAQHELTFRYHKAY